MIAGAGYFRKSRYDVSMINSTVLSNGVRVITERVEHMHTVSIGIWVANGSRHETPDCNGVAHFIEHLLFKGTGRRTARQISLEIDSMGGVLNAFTGHEYVCYYAKVLATCLPRVADLLTDIFLHSTFPADEIERERKVILQEIKMRDDSPEEAIHDRFHQNFYSGHALGNPIIGTDAIINGISRNAILQFKESRYRPEDVIITAAGNVDHDELLDLVRDEFSAIPPSLWRPDGVAFHPRGGRRVNQCERDLEQTLICMGTRALQQDHPERYAMHLLNTILGGGMSSRLFQEVREKMGLAYSVYSYIISHADSGALVIHSGTERKHCSEVVNIALTEMRRLKHEAVTQAELDSAREQIKGKLLMSLESSDSLMTRLAKNFIYLGCPQPVESILAGFDAVSVDDVAGIAEMLFDGECLNVEIMGKTAGLALDAGSMDL
jgi:predicted Zn-dependent peptidase